MRARDAWAALLLLVGQLCIVCAEPAAPPSSIDSRIGADDVSDHEEEEALNAVDAAERDGALVQDENEEVGAKEEDAATEDESDEEAFVEEEEDQDREGDDGSFLEEDEDIEALSLQHQADEEELRTLDHSLRRSATLEARFAQLRAMAEDETEGETGLEDEDANEESAEDAQNDDGSGLEDQSADDDSVEDAELNSSPSESYDEDFESNDHNEEPDFPVPSDSEQPADWSEQTGAGSVDGASVATAPYSTGEAVSLPFSDSSSVDSEEDGAETEAVALSPEDATAAQADASAFASTDGLPSDEGHSAAPPPIVGAMSASLSEDSEVPEDASLASSPVVGTA
jgi:hypothetical protein